MLRSALAEISSLWFCKQIMRAVYLNALPIGTYLKMALRELLNFLLDIFTMNLVESMWMYYRLYTMKACFNIVIMFFFYENIFHFAINK